MVAVVREVVVGVAAGEPVVFDPAPYYGDREADVAFTYVFGGFGREFYEGYEAAYPLPEGHEGRREIYNWYHVANHAVMFGGGYVGQAREMLGRVAGGSSPRLRLY